LDEFKSLDNLVKSANKWINDLFGESGLFKNFDFQFDFDNPFVNEDVTKQEKTTDIKPKIPWEKLPLPVKEEVEEAVLWPLLKKDVAKEYGIKLSKGILLFGPPGCGKTLLMKALAKRLLDANVKIYLVHLSEILSKWYGQSEQRLKSLFEKALREPPAFLFIDEFESIGRKRESYNMDDVTPRLLSILLGLLDGLGSNDDVGIVASTNRVEFIDDALLRPGRFDKVIYIPPPDYHLRKEIFLIHGTGRKKDPNIDYEILAEATYGFSGADIALIWEEASRVAMRRAMKSETVEPINMADIENIVNRMQPSIHENDLLKYEEMRKRFQRLS